jgi:copper(I)-binding protein
VKSSCLALVASCAALLLSACQNRSDTAPPAGLVVTGAWARATPVTTVGAAYFSIANHGAEPDTLLAVASPVAGRAELHRTLTEDGVVRMRPAGQVAIPAGQVVKAEPGGLHVMLHELAAPLAPGDAVPLALTFARAGTVTVTLEVRAATGLAHYRHAGQ